LHDSSVPAASPGAQCGSCSSGDPPITNAGDDFAVEGGQTALLNGTAGDPNAPPGTPLPIDVEWVITDEKGLSGLVIADPTSAQTTLTTPVVTSTVTIELEFRVQNISTNLCSCADPLFVTIMPEGSGGARTASLNYSFNGVTFESAANGATVMQNVVLPVDIDLQGGSNGFITPTYSWLENSAVATLSSPTGVNTTLQVSQVVGEGNITIVVTLTVAESGNPAENVQSTVTFVLTPEGATNGPENVDFTMSAQGEVEPGTLVILKGTAEKAGGGSIGNLTFSWNAQTEGGEVVDVLTKHNRAALIVPAAAGEELEVWLVVSEGASSAPPVVKSLHVVEPRLYFAHFGVGPAGEDTLLQVEVILVNDTEEDIEEGEGRILFFSQSGEPTEVSVDGGEPGSSHVFSLASESAKRFEVSADQARVGWFKIVAPVKLAGLIQYRYLEYPSLRTKVEASVFPSTLGQRMTTSIPPGANNNVFGMAIANPTSEQVEVKVYVVKDGSPFEDGIGFLTLGPYEQFAAFLGQEGLNYRQLNEDFPGGTLVIEAHNGTRVPFVALILKLTPDGVLSTVPLAVRSE
jgi:hypothetical protein